MKAPDQKHAYSGTPFQRFERLIRGLASVPKKEIEAEEARWRAQREASKKKRASG